MNYLTLWQSLYQENAVSTAQAPTAPEMSITMPWLGRVLMAILGWVSGLFLIGALALPFSFFTRLPSAFLLIGTGLLFAAYRLFVAAKQSEFLAQFALAISVAGQCAIVFSLFQLLGEKSVLLLASIAFVVQTVLIVLMPNATHRSLSTLFAIVALSVLLHKAEFLSLLPALIAAGAAGLWLTESRWVSIGRDALIRPVANALWLALLVVCSFSFLRIARELQIHLPTSAIALALVWIVYLACFTHGMESSMRMMTLLAGAIFAFASLRAPGLIACALALTMAFARGSHVATALALIGFVSYLFGYYYQTQNTLLDKAITLAVIAVACWVTAALLYVLRGKIKS
jgi:Domain of unknown function (DUF4401)